MCAADGAGRGVGAGPAGFTLVEALVALTIVGGVLVALLAAVGSDLRASRAATEARHVTAAAGELLERLPLLPTAELRDRVGEWRRMEPPFGAYRWRAVARPVEDTPGLLEVRARVEGPEASLPFTTRLYRPRERPARGAPP